MKSVKGMLLGIFFIVIAIYIDILGAMTGGIEFYLAVLGGIVTLISFFFVKEETGGSSSTIDND
ncbi:hypothetical protein [Paenibacillus xerothermodurans]|uniref:Uncharacterized protein n=1 Tax=Paenibacillus xerothermodurans TaxID=1977292 RepID=A0A2W1NMG2_PAEXE|nr:hypothetical protein [Paenibacillus xerothermodurans]PZE19046.1 hypothetical protein CBW46_020725 [Paenibacillus xerothermodurans]